MTSGSSTKQQPSSGGKPPKDSKQSESKKSEPKDKDGGPLAPSPPPPTKVVVRRLPPTMTRAQFVESVSPLPEHDYLIFSGPDTTLGTVSNGVSQATINFIHPEDVWDFREKFDGYVFDVGDGREHSAIVEFAPNQKAPKNGGSVKADPKMGSLETDRDYVKFMRALENPEESESHTTGKAKTIEQYMDELEAKEREMRNNKTYTTPLLDFVREQRLEKRAKRDMKRDLKRESRKKREEERKKLRDEERKKRRDKKEAFEESRSEADKLANSSGEKGLKTSRSAEKYNKDVKRSEKPSRRERRNRRSGGREEGEESRVSSKGTRSSSGNAPSKPAAGQIAETAEQGPHERRKNGGNGRRDRETGGRQRSRHSETGDPVKQVAKDVANLKIASRQNADAATDEGNAGKRRSDREDKSEKSRESASSKETPAKSRAELRKNTTDLKKDKVKNKERPAMEIYRPGMGRFSSQSISKAEEGKGGGGSSRSDSKAGGKEHSRRKETGEYSSKNSVSVSGGDSEKTVSSVSTVRLSGRDSNSIPTETAYSDSGKSAGRPTAGGSGRAGNPHTRKHSAETAGPKQPPAQTPNNRPFKGDESRSTPVKDSGSRGNHPKTAKKEYFGDKPAGQAATASAAMSTPGSAVTTEGGKSGKSYKDKRRERQMLRQNKEANAADT